MEESDWSDRKEGKEERGGGIEDGCGGLKKKRRKEEHSTWRMNRTSEENDQEIGDRE